MPPERNSGATGSTQAPPASNGRTALGRIAGILAWVAVIYGALAAGASAPVLYLLLTGTVRPGEPYFIDELAPSQEEAIGAVLLGIGFVGGGALLRFLARKYLGAS